MNYQGFRKSDLSRLATFLKLNASDIYLIVVGLSGLTAVFWGVILLPTYIPIGNFVLLVLLAIAAQFATTSVPISKNSGITFEVGTAVSAATIPLFGPAAAALTVAFSSVAIWLFKPKDQTTWKKSSRQLFFNTGMWSVVLYVAGLVYEQMVAQFATTVFLRNFIPWLVVGIVIDQLNIWLLLIMVKLQQGPKMNLLKAWQSNLWASGINIAIISAGGGLLAYSATNFGRVGLLMFFLPVLLSAYAFRLYVRQMQEHMNNLEEIIAERTQELSAFMREKDAFLAVLSHDMKTPLTTIGMYAEMLMQYPSLMQKKPEVANILRTNQQALTEMVENILDLEKLQVGGSLMLDIAPFDLVAVLENLTDIVWIQAERKSIEISQDFEVSSLFISGDQYQIKRLFQNLLSNAIKYSANGTHIRLRLWSNENWVHICVKDNGYGIPEAEVPYIFDRFRRVDKHMRLAAGTGIGLAVVKAIVETHRGQVSVTSQEGVGSEFMITLPLTPEKAPL